LEIAPKDAVLTYKETNRELCERAVRVCGSRLSGNEVWVEVK